MKDINDIDSSTSIESWTDILLQMYSAGIDVESVIDRVEIAGADMTEVRELWAKIQLNIKQ